MDLNELEAVMKMMTKYTVDQVELPNGIKITKAIHLPVKPRKPYSKKDAIIEKELELPVNLQVSDDVLFFQSSAPEINLNNFNVGFNKSS